MLVSMTAFWSIMHELLDVIRPGCLVEIGGDQGECTQKLCAWALPRQAHVHVIETHPSEKLMQVLADYELAKLHVGPSLQILPGLEEKAACFIIDGDHNYYTVYNELKLIAQHNTPDLIMLHDVGWPWGRRDMYYDLDAIPQENRRDPVVDPDLGIVPGHRGVFRGKGFRSNGRFAFAKTEGGPENGVMTAVQDFLTENSGYQLFMIDCVFGFGVLVSKSAACYGQIETILKYYVDNPLISLLEQDRLRTFVASFNKPSFAPSPVDPSLRNVEAAKKFDFWRFLKGNFSKKNKDLAEGQAARPFISVVIAVHNMRRVAPRTLRSFTAAYQNIHPDTYEVIVVENGSDQPLSKEQVEAFGPNFRYFVIPNASPSPVAALNFGVKQSKGQMVALMIDGAHLVTPGVLTHALRALKAYKNPVVSVLAMQLGPQMQRLSIKDGYSEKVEDGLLQQIEWPRDGYMLFGISSLTGVNAGGWFLPMLESNCIFLLRSTYDELNGFDARFDAPGGGLANLDFYQRLCEHPTTELIVLLGEGSFHQIHGGVSTNNVDDNTFNENLANWKAQYKSIRKKDFKLSTKKPEYLGNLVSTSASLLNHSVEQWMANNQQGRSDGNPR